jgi:hypothetical protein
MGMKGQELIDLIQEHNLYYYDFLLDSYQEMDKIVVNRDTETVIVTTTEISD